MIYKKPDGTVIKLDTWQLLAVDRVKEIEKDKDGHEVLVERNKWRVIVEMPGRAYWLTEHGSEKAAHKSLAKLVEDLADGVVVSEAKVGLGSFFKR